MESQNTKLVPAIESWTTEIMMEMVRQGVGIGYFVKNVIDTQSDKDQFEVISFNDELPAVDVCCVYIEDFLTTATHKFIELLTDENGLNISQRNITVSTCGIVPKMYELAWEKLPVTLSVSLHAPNDEIRRRLMPVANTWSIREILEACRVYIQETGRRVIFEYALTEGINADKAQAEELAGILRGMQCHVNLIPLNAVKERNLNGVNEQTVKDFMQILESRHISVTRRREMGDDIEGACGQLRRRTINTSRSEETCESLT
jgi:adenine C2-methylase RlmN of 23S rRNA A2503 and tRNA A37